MQGFSLLQYRGESLVTIADLFSSLAFARRVSAAFGVSSFKLASLVIGAKIADATDGVLDLKELREQGVVLVAKRITAPKGERWLALALTQDATQAAQLAQLSGVSLLDAATVSFLRGSSRVLPSSRAQSLRLVLHRLALLLEGGSDPQMWNRCRQRLEHVDHLLDAAAQQALVTADVHLTQTPPLPLSPPHPLTPFRSQSTSAFTTHSSLSSASSVPPLTPAPTGAAEDAKDEPKLDVAREERYVAEHSWAVAGASVWQLQSDGQAKNRIELYKSGAFARDVSASTGASSFRHFCAGMVRRFVRGEPLQQATQSRYPVYGRLIKQSVGPNFVFIVVFDGRHSSMAEKFERLNHSLFIAYVASAFAEQSDHRMSKKLGSVRATLKLLDELDNRRQVRSQFVTNVRRKVDRLLSASAELRYSRTLRESGNIPRFANVSPVPPPDTESSAPSASAPSAPSSPDSQSLSQSLSYSQSLGLTSSHQSTPTPVESAQAQLLQYLLTSNRDLSAHNLVLMDQIESITKELQRFQAIAKNCRCGALDSSTQLAASGSSLKA